MPVSKLALGINARNYLYIRPNNRRKSKARADNKLATKERLDKYKIPTPELITVFRSLADVRSYDWASLKGSFVLKPARGYGGGGITIVRKWDGTTGRAEGRDISLPKLEAEIFSILDGAYSLNNLPDIAFLEKRVKVSSTMRKLTKKGVPDLRVIVAHKVPIMAMLRLPTSYSSGRANLHQGAVGIGVDMRTGITTKAVFYGEEVEFIPDTKTKVRGIKIPHWNTVLRYAVRTQVVSGLGYAGIDIVFDEVRGPLVLEVNARPGLQIQLANGDSLRTRLERIEDMRVPSADYGIDLAKRLFAERALSGVLGESNILNVVERVTVTGPKGKKVVQAKIDTGAYRTAIDVSLVEKLGLKTRDDEIRVRSGTGAQKRQTVRATIRMRGQSFETTATFNDRAHMRFPIIIGRRDLRGYLIDPTLRIQ